MKTVVVWGMAAVTALSASVAVAATLSVGSATLGVGNGAVPHCDVNGFTHSFTTSRGNVIGVTVGDIADPACEDGDLQRTLTNAAGDSVASAGPQTVPTDGDGIANSMTLPTSPQPAAGQVLGIHLNLKGP